MFNELLNYFGYFKDSEYKEKYEKEEKRHKEYEVNWSDIYSKEVKYHRKLEQQINGLLDGYGWLESRDLNNNLLMTSLIMLQGQDEVVLKPEFINDIADKHLETVVAIEADGSVKLTVLTTEELDGEELVEEDSEEEYEPT